MKSPHLGMILAADVNGGIGINNTIPWRLKGDLKNFKNLTTGQVVIMGRKTYESLPSPLVGRISIIVSTTMIPFDDVPDTHVVSSIDEALELGKRFGTDWIYFIGGVSIYEEALKIVNTVHYTQVHLDVETDAKIPNFNFHPSVWTPILHIAAPIEYDPETGLGILTHSYITYTRNKKGN